jgi:hypothetical protein
MGAHPRERKLSEQELNQETMTDNDINIERFEWLPYTWFEILPNAITSSVPVVNALERTSVRKWSDLILLTRDQVSNLSHQSPITMEITPLHVNQKEMVTVALALHHHISRKMGKPMDPMSMSTLEFDLFRVNHYRPELPIVCWETPLTTNDDLKTNQETSTFLDFTRLIPTDRWMESQ